jgi:hypothetical protein
LPLFCQEAISKAHLGLHSGFWPDSLHKKLLTYAITYLPCYTRAMTIKQTAFVICITLSMFSIPAQADVIDTPERLVIPSGETYTLCGAHSYSTSIEISGTLTVAAYDGAGNTGSLELTAPVIAISSSGWINANGKGYRSDEGPGKGTAGSNGGGGGGGHGGSGGTMVYRWPPVAPGGGFYGSIAHPDTMGSGGGRASSGIPGGSGGGCIKINGGSINIDGMISSDGNAADTAGSGAGGSIFIVSDEVTGRGCVIANGGGTEGTAGGAGGRIALYSRHNEFSGNLQCFGGALPVLSIYGTTTRASAGTIYTATDAETPGDLVINNDSKPGYTTPVWGEFATTIVSNAALVISSSSFRSGCLTVISSGIYTNAADMHLTALEVANGGEVHLDTGSAQVDGAIHIMNCGRLHINVPVTAYELHIASGGVVTHLPLDPDFEVHVRELNIDSCGEINVTGCGYRGGNPDAVVDKGPGGGGDFIAGGGGGYGGNGGTGRRAHNAVVGEPGHSYGSRVNPVDFGSGGGKGNGSYSGGNGGGKVLLIVEETLRNDGVVRADGSMGYGDNGGGSGGSINVFAGGVTGSGLFSAEGGCGQGELDDSGGGGGGRIAINTARYAFTGQVNVQPGDGGNPPAEQGTVMVPRSGPDAPGTFSQANVAHAADSSLHADTVAKVYSTALTVDGTLRGTITISSFTCVAVKTGAFAGKGFCKGSWNAQLDGVLYSGQCHGSFFYDVSAGSYTLKAVMEGDIDGSVEGFLAGHPVNNDFTALAATWTFCFPQGASASMAGVLVANGPILLLQADNQTATQLRCSQISSRGALSGSYTGSMDSVLTTVIIDDISHPFRGEGFSSLSYQWDRLNGYAWGYCRSLSPETADMRMVAQKPLWGILTGMFRDADTSRNLWWNITRMDIGEQPQPDVSVSITSPENVSPGQFCSFAVVLTNKGCAASRFLKITVTLPNYFQFKGADGQWEFEQLGESDWVTYPDENLTPKQLSWILPELSGYSSAQFNFNGTIVWGTPVFGLDMSVDVYHYTPQ